MPSVLEGLPTVALIIPARNEERFIDDCLESIVSGPYPKDKLQVFVVDGMSEDGTRLIVDSFVERYPFIHLVDNPAKGIPHALNLGISHAADSEVLIRMDAHCGYQPDYVDRCVSALLAYGADNVGGRWRVEPRDGSLVGRAIAIAHAHRFGIGNARYRLAGASDSPMWEEGVPFFACKREVFERTGGFDERLLRSEDVDFSQRIRKAGFRTLLVPGITVTYYPRSDLKSFWKHNVLNGMWAVLPIKYVGHNVVKVRHLVPLALVGGLALLAALSVVSPSLFLPLLLGTLATYFSANLAVSTSIAGERRDLRLLAALLIVFAALHIGYGAGSLWGVVKVAIASSLRLIRARRVA